MFRRLFWVSLAATLSLILAEALPAISVLGVTDSLYLFLICLGCLLPVAFPLTVVSVAGLEGLIRSWRQYAPTEMHTPKDVLLPTVYMLFGVSLILKVGMAVGKVVQRSFRQAEYQHLAILLSAVAVGAVCIILYPVIRAAILSLLAVFSRWRSIPKLTWLSMTLLMWVVFAITIVLLPRLFPSLASVNLRALWLVWTWGGMMVLGRYFTIWPQNRVGRLWFVSILLLGGAPFLSDMVLSTQYSSVNHVMRHTVMTKVMLKKYQQMTDDDADGSSDRFGGRDCDDLDPKITPGRLDIPNDNIDQNCTGGDLKQQTTTANRAGEILSNRTRYNVVLLTIDALRYDRLKDDMPFLKSLADSSIHFEHAYSHGASTYWSMAALLASKLPSALEMGRDQTPIGTETLLPEILMRNGWRTNLFANVTIFFVRGLSQGFRQRDKNYATSHFTVHGEKPGAVHMTKGMLGKLKSLQASKQTQPTFLWGHYYDPHDPYFEVEGFPAEGNDDFSRYRAICRSVDASIKTFVDGLKSMGVWDKTILVITSDHGDEFGEHGGRFHGKSLYEEMTRVPLIMRVPDLEPRRVDTPVGQMDIAPTILGLLGLPIPKSFVGINHAPQLVRNQPIEAKPVLMEVLPDSNYSGHILGMRTVDKKVLYYPRRHYFEVFDLSSDPQERENLAAESADLKALVLSYVDEHLYRLALGKTGAKVPLGTPRGFGKRKRTKSK